jgi:DNA-binding IclR family transcriptional regulator
MATPATNSVLKAFEILDLFQVHGRLRASQVAELLDMPRSSAYRLLVTLRSVGALDATPEGEFSLSLRLFEIGCSAPLRRRLHEAASDALQRLTSIVGAPVQLGIIGGDEVLFLEKLGLTRNRASGGGMRGPLHATGIGKALLAFSPMEFQQHVLALPLEPFTRATLTKPADLRRELEDIRQKGYAVARGEKRLGYYSIARPIRQPFVGGVIGAVSAILRGPDDIEKVNRVLQRTCKEIESGLESRTA